MVKKQEDKPLSGGARREDFLPVSRADMNARGWDELDILLVTGDAYVDHGSFGAAVIARVLEAEGYRVGILAQPDWKRADAFQVMGRPRLMAMATAGNLDSCVAHYTVARRRRSTDAYSPGGQAGLRPDRASIVYAQRLREAFPGLPVILGGLEVSLRRWAHYDYWDDAVRRSLLLDAGASLLVYGMGERAVREIARRLSEGEPVTALRNIRGTSYVAPAADCELPTDAVWCPPWQAVQKDKKAYASATRTQMEHCDARSGKTLVQPYDTQYLVQNPPALPLTTEEFDAVAELPYTRDWHPMYDAQGGVPALEEVKFSLIHNRGCFGGCHFCSLSFHQGRYISVRSHDSLLREARALTQRPDFKGYIHDVGGPTANFRQNACSRTNGMCVGKNCLTPKPCANLNTSHADFVALLRKLRALPGVKKVFVRSGLRYDMLLLDREGEALRELVQHHISGQLKVAPEHCVDSVLDFMGKPHWVDFQLFVKKYQKINELCGKKQYLVPYFISSHPGCTLKDAVTLALALKERGVMPEQVQDFYPTPGTLSTCMYYTGIHPLSGESVYVPRSPEEKAMQRALLQWKRPEKRALVRAALRKAGRADLIGHGPGKLVP